MALADVELETLVSKLDTLTTRPAPFIFLQIYVASTGSY